MLNRKVKYKSNINYQLGSRNSCWCCCRLNMYRGCCIAGIVLMCIISRFLWRCSSSNYWRCRRSDIMLGLNIECSLLLNRVSINLWRCSRSNRWLSRRSSIMSELNSLCKMELCRDSKENQLY